VNGIHQALEGSRRLSTWRSRAFEMCSGSEAGSYLRLIDFVYHSTLQGSRRLSEAIDLAKPDFPARDKLREGYHKSRRCSRDTYLEVGVIYHVVYHQVYCHISPRILIYEEHSVTLSAGTPLCPYGLAYRRACGLSTYGVLKKSM